MSFIQPNTTVKIMHNVPLDETYENTIYFTDIPAQLAQMQNYVKYTFQNPPAAFTYQRINSNTMRVNKPADDLYDCNYLMFQNTAYGQKWFYAFITAVNYINDNVTEVQYSLDVMQTWMFDYELEECFVEREHTDNDTFGNNLQPENISTGEYEIEDIYMPPEFHKNNLRIVLASTYRDGESSGWPTAGGGMYQGIFSGCDYLVYDPNNALDLTKLQDYIASLYNIIGDRSNSIVSMFMCPNALVVAKGSAYGGWSTPNSSSLRIHNSGAIADGYTPHNKKLYTYPYNFLYCTNFQGIGQVFPYEYWTGANLPNSYCHFFFNGDFTTTPSIVCAPVGYKGQVSTNYDEALTVSGWPQCTWNTDAFKAWMAQARGLAAMALVGAGAAAGAGALGVLAGGALNTLGNTANSPNPTQITGPIRGAGISGASVVAGAVSSVEQERERFGGAIHEIAKRKMQEGFNAYVNPIHQHGNQSGSSLLVNNILGFGFARKHIRREYAEIIDQYFDMYGYATNRVKKPNTHVRTHWTYTKTVGCCIVGSIPMESAAKICSIYDHGIRFWTDADKIGKYSTYRQTNNTLS